MQNVIEVKDNFKQAMYRAIDRNEILGFMYATKGGTRFHIVFKPTRMLQIKGMDAVKGYKDGVETTENERTLYIGSMGAGQSVVRKSGETEAFLGAHAELDGWLALTADGQRFNADSFYRIAKVEGDQVTLNVYGSREYTKYMGKDGDVEDGGNYWWECDMYEVSHYPASFLERTETAIFENGLLLAADGRHYAKADRLSHVEKRNRRSGTRNRR